MPPKALPKQSPTSTASPRERDLAAFVNGHLPGLRRWLTALGCDTTSAEDHCQEALLAALHHGVHCWPLPRAWAWLRTTTRNLHLMHLREQQRRPDIDFDEAEESWQRASGDEDGGDAALAALRACLEHTDDRDKDLLERRYTEQQSRDAMAAALGIGTAGIKQALRRARARLRTCMEHRLMEDLLEEEQ